MTTNMIKVAQSYLTVGPKKIVNIEELLTRHSQDKVISLLETLVRDKREEVKDLVSIELTGNELERAISEWFRIQLAINVLRAEVSYEEAKTEQGAAKCRRSA